MNIIFFGSDDFAAAHLAKLATSNQKVVAVVTQPDKPAGRGMKVAPSTVKTCALGNNIKLFQPDDLKESHFLKELKRLEPDLIVVIAYGKFLPKELLQMPKSYAINVHSSLLPRYRGAAPINWAIINGEVETGITVMKLNEKMDAGDILTFERVLIEPRETAATLRAKMMSVGPKLLMNTIALIEKGQCAPLKQDEAKATLAPKLTKAHGKIDWQKNALALDHQVRGLLPWPGAYTTFKGKMLKILKCETLDAADSHKKAGEIVHIGKLGITVACGKGQLLLQTVHLQDAKEMSAYEFIVGQRVGVGFRFE